jgi:LytS/YehU family sensor histidine kinase
MNEFALLVPLLQNAAMLLAMVVICAVISSRFSKRTGHKLGDDRKLQVLTGFMMGLIAIAIILTPVEYAQNIILDSRSVLISLTALFFGTVPALVAMTIAALFRLYLGGAASITAILVIVSSGVIGLLWRKKCPLPSCICLVAWSMQ